MFKRVIATAPSQASRVLATAARPSFHPSVRAAAPAVSQIARRSYHEKDMSLL